MIACITPIQNVYISGKIIILFFFCSRHIGVKKQNQKENLLMNMIKK